MESLGKFLVILFSLIIFPIINGFVFMKLWLWFVVPIFGLQPLKILESVGILLLLSFITKAPEKTDNKDFWEDFFTSCANSVLKAIFALLFGYFLTFFI